MEVIRSLRGGHTVILISHRLANVTDSDEIFFLRNGRLAERGTHEQLLRAADVEENAASGEGNAQPGGAEVSPGEGGSFEDGGYAALYRAQQALENLGKGEKVCVEAG